MFRKVFTFAFLATIAATIVERLFGKPSPVVNPYGRKRRRV